MVTIRLRRGGAKGRPFYSIVVTDSRRAPTGMYIEHIGFVNPIAAENEEQFRVDMERYDYWVSCGAQPSDRVKSLVKKSASNTATA